MPGKLCDGTTNGHYHINSSSAYCEGRAAAAAEALVGTNPHEANSELNVVWTSGFDSWAADPDTGGPDCCDIAFGGGFVEVFAATTHTHEHEHPM